MRRLGSVALAIVVVTLTGCHGGVRVGGGLVPSGPGLTARCRYGATQTSVLVTEWPASEKADLEALVYEGRGVAVAFSGCQMRVLPQCRLPGRYVWQRTTPSTDYVEIASELDLYTKLPLGAVSLAGELARSGSLTVATTVAGQARLIDLVTAQVPNDGECAQATHVVNAISMGAFTLTASGREEAKASAEASFASVGGGGNRALRIVRSAGDTDTCASSSLEAPAPSCASPIHVFLSPIAGRAETLGPPGTAKVDFVSASPTTRWDVYIDDQATCTTPCSRWVDPSRPIVLRARDLPQKLRVAQLDAAQGPLQITAKPRSDGEFVTGLTFTALGGMGVLAGVTVTSVGFGIGNENMSTGGLITLVASGLVTTGSIWMMLDSRPVARIRPVFGSEGSLVFGPGFVAGSF